MKILALEFSSQRLSVAVVRSRWDVDEITQTGPRAGNALGLIEEALSRAGVEREQIECLVIGIGPGSYMGIRSAIALAQGRQLARPVRLLAISSVECLAAQAQADGLTGRVTVAIDAQRNEFYLATYEIERDGFRETVALHIASAAQVEASTGDRGHLVGPDIKKHFETGKSLFPSAGVLGTLAIGRENFVAAEKLEPIYLRETTFVKAPPPRVV